MLAAVAWVPLLVLSAIEGLAIGGATLPFVYDLGAHVRFLLAVPVLILAEIPIGFRLRRVAAHFVETGIVRPKDQARFAEIVAETLRFRDARTAELVVLGAAYLSTYTALSGATFQGGSTWYLPRPGAGLTPVGYWYAFVAIPMFQFLLYRWVYRVLVWGRFLRAVSRLDLELVPTHPDGAGGLGFVGKGTIPFGVLLFATSAVVASAIASRVLFAGARLESFQVTYAALLVLVIVIFTAPLFVFAPTLPGPQAPGPAHYETLATRYTQRFHRKWITGEEATEEQLLGTADIQSLADLGNSYGLVKGMRAVPIELADFIAIAIPGLIPALPLAATVMPVTEILKSMLHLLA